MTKICFAIRSRKILLQEFVFINKVQAPLFFRSDISNRIAVDGYCRPPPHRSVLEELLDTAPPSGRSYESAQKRNLEQIARNTNSIVDQLETAVESAAKDGDNFDSVERKTIESALQIGFPALQLLFALQGDGDLGEEVHTANGKIAKRSEAKLTTNLRSISARLSLPAGRWSFLLQEFPQMLGVDQAYDQAMKNLGKNFGSDFSVDTAERVNGNMGRSAGEFLDDLPTPEAGSEAKLLVATKEANLRSVAFMWASRHVRIAQSISIEREINVRQPFQADMETRCAGRS